MTEPLWDDERPRVGAMGPVKVRVPAKINLHLGVGALRPDGFHELTTVYHAIALFDELTARPADTLALTMDGEGAGELALDDGNLVIRAVQAAGRRHRARAARPAAPAQADPARGRPGRRQRRRGRRPGRLRRALGHRAQPGGPGRHRRRLGSDVPFLVLGGTALGTGRGETVSPVLAPGNAWHWVVAVADGGLSTPEVYRELDRLREPPARRPRPSARPTRSWPPCASATPPCWPSRSSTTWSRPRCPCGPALRATLAAGVAAGALAGLVSGSGPTCVFLCRRRRPASRVAEALTASGTCRDGPHGDRAPSRAPGWSDRWPTSSAWTGSARGTGRRAPLLDRGLARPGRRRPGRRGRAQRRRQVDPAAAAHEGRGARRRPGHPPPGPAGAGAAADPRPAAHRHRPRRRRRLASGCRPRSPPSTNGPATPASAPSSTDSACPASGWTPRSARCPAASAAGSRWPRCWFARPTC